MLVSTAGGETLARRNKFLSWHPVERGRPLPADSELSCSAGCAVRTYDGSTLTLDPGAHIAISQVTFVPMGGTFAALGRRFELLEGSVTAHVVVDPKRPRTLVIGTPNDGMVAVRPGEAQVVVDGERAGVACLQGGAHVKQGKGAIEVRAGEAASLSSARASLATHPLETAPTWTGPTGKLDDPQPLALALGEQPAAPVVAWQPMKGAIGYRIELASDSAFTKVVEAARVGAKEHRFAAKTLREGSYFARVIALDSDGIASRPSSPVPVRVVQVRTPAGGYADVEHATVVAPEGTSLSTSNRDRSKPTFVSARPSLAGPTTRSTSSSTFTTRAAASIRPPSRPTCKF